MREISACGKHVGRRRRDLQQSVNAHPQHDPGAKWLDMDVGCAQLDGFLEQIIDGTHDGCAAGKIAQAVDVVVGLDRIASVAFWCGERVLAEPLGQRSRDILKRCNGKRDRPAEGELCGTHAGRIGRIGDDQSIGATFLELAWKDRHLAQEAVRKWSGQR